MSTDPTRRADDFDPEFLNAKMETIATVAAKKAIAEMFEIFGHDVTTPKGRKIVQENFAFLNDARQGTRNLKSLFHKTFWGITFTGMAYAFWKGMTIISRSSGL